MKSFTIAQGVKTVSPHHLLSGQLPEKILIAFVDNAALSGAKNTNPYNFKNYNITRIALSVDGMKSRLPPYLLDFRATSGFKVSQAYNALLNAVGADNNHTPGLTLADYVYGSTIFPFLLTPNLENSADDSMNLIRNGTVRLEVTFGTELPNTVSAICYLEYNSLMAINQYKQVILDFAN
jgi:hypothetical protein